MTGLFKTALVIAGVILLGAAGWTFATRWHPSLREYPLQGLDLGSNPEPVEWGTVRARGADFAYLVATDGTQRDPAFEANWAALPEAGLRRGAVALYSLCDAPDAQANAFNTFVPRADDALPAAVDLSFDRACTERPTREALIADLKRFLAMVETHTGKPMLVRIAKPVEKQYELAAAIDRPYWAIRNFRTPTYAGRPWRLWRATDFRRVEGVEGPVNWDVVAP